MENTLFEPGNAPRVLPADLEAAVVDFEIVKHVSRSGQVLRWAVLTTYNGFAVTGRPSCAVRPENDDAEKGEQIALENAKDELWPLLGYALREQMFQQQSKRPVLTDADAAADLAGTPRPDNPGCADGGILDGTNRTTGGTIGQP